MRIVFKKVQKKLIVTLISYQNLIHGFSILCYNLVPSATVVKARKLLRFII